MAWDLATGKAMLGIPVDDTTKDAAIGTIMDIVLATVETHLQRRLLEAEEHISFFNVHTTAFRLPRWPVSQITEINGAPPVEGLRVDMRRGIIWGPFVADIVNVTYTGGYNPLPVDLERALWEIFLMIWGKSDPATGAPVPGSGATVVQGSGEVSSVTLNDFMTVRFDVGSQAVGGESAQTAAQNVDIWGALAPWASVLSMYRSENGSGVGFA